MSLNSGADDEKLDELLFYSSNFKHKICCCCFSINKVHCVTVATYFRRTYKCNVTVV